VEHSLLGECPEQLKPYRWKPGESGNPNGLGKRLSFEKCVARILDEKFERTDQTKREQLARVFVDAMLQCDGRLIKEFLAREWPAIQKLEVDLPTVSDDALETSVNRFLAGEDEPVPKRTNGNGAAAS
jgi:hypothetical protein